MECLDKGEEYCGDDRVVGGRGCTTHRGTIILKYELCGQCCNVCWLFSAELGSFLTDCRRLRTNSC